MKKDNFYFLELVLGIILSISFVACSSDNPIIDDEQPIDEPTQEEIINQNVDSVGKYYEGAIFHSYNFGFIKFKDYNNGKISAYYHDFMATYITGNDVIIDNLILTIDTKNKTMYGKYNNREYLFHYDVRPSGYVTFKSELSYEGFAPNIIEQWGTAVAG